MIRANLKPNNDTTKQREALRKLRDVELSRNKGNNTNVKMCRGRQPLEIKEAVRNKKRKIAEKEGKRKTFAELEAEELLRKADEKIKEAIISDKFPASHETVKKATKEVAKAKIRCR